MFIEAISIWQAPKIYIKMPEYIIILIPQTWDAEQHVFFTGLCVLGTILKHNFFHVHEPENWMSEKLISTTRPTSAKWTRTTAHLWGAIETPCALDKHTYVTHCADECMCFCYRPTFISRLFLESYGNECCDKGWGANLISCPNNTVFSHLD